MIVVVKTFDVATDVEMRSRTINTAKPKDKEWLDRVMVWAFNNHCGLELYNLQDEQNT